MRMQLHAPCTFDNWTRSGSPHNVLHSSSYTLWVGSLVETSGTIDMRTYGIVCTLLSCTSVATLASFESQSHAQLFVTCSTVKRFTILQSDEKAG